MLFLTEMHSKTIRQVFKELNTTDRGLSQAEAEERLKQYGLNEIKEARSSPWEIFIRPVQEALLSGYYVLQ